MLNAFFSWLAAVYLLRFWWKRKGVDLSAAAPGRSALSVIAAAGIGGFIWFKVLTVGGGLGLGIALCGVWLAYLFGLLVAHWVTRTALEPARRVARSFVLLNGVFFVLAVATVGFGAARAGTLDQAIVPLSYSPAAREVYQLVMPRIIRSGDEAVKPLIVACERAVERVDDLDNAFVVSRASFCLAKIGGPEAEQFVGKLVRERVDFSTGCVYSEWAHHVCFAYAECAGDRAAPDLIALYERRGHGRWAESRYAVLAALVKTGGKVGVLFALDHIDELLALDEDDVSDYDCIAEVVDGLIDSHEPDELRRLPLYGRNLFGGLDRVPVESIREDSAEDLVTKLPPRGEIRWRNDVVQRWRTMGQDTLQRWRERFSQAP